jgi:hypothetical protein
MSALQRGVAVRLDGATNKAQHEKHGGEARPMEMLLWNASSSVKI